MISLRLRFCAGLLLVLFASMASSQNALEQLLGGQNQDANSSEFLGVPNAMVLTIDGIDKNMLAGGLFGLVPATGSTTGRGDSYLIEPVNEKWAFADDVRYYAWSGDTAQTSADLKNLKIQIAGLAELAQRRDKPFVIFAHSWGSVLAYRAISELTIEGKLPGSSIRKLVTIGSPLGANCSDVSSKKGYAKCILARETTDKHVTLAGPQAALGSVQSWTNFWIQRDDISGPIEGLDQNIELQYSYFNPHQAYYSNSSLFGRITDAVAKDLAMYVSSGQIAGIPEQPNNPVSTSDPTPSTPKATVAPPQNDTSTPVARHSGFDLYGLKLGMDYETAVSILADRIPGLIVVRVYDPSVTDPARRKAMSEKSGLLFPWRRGCVDIKFPKDHCVSGFTADNFLEDQRYNIRVELIEDFENNPGKSIIYSIIFSHMFNASTMAFAPLDAAIRKYGPSDYDNAFTKTDKRYKKDASGKRSKDASGKSIVEIITTDVPATSRGWYVSSGVGIGQLDVVTRKRSTPGNFSYSITLKVEGAITGKLADKMEKAFLAARAAQDSPF